jgi:hypothetical protein
MDRISSDPLRKMPKKSKHEAFRSKKSKPERFVEMGKLTAKLQELSHCFHKTIGGGYVYHTKPVLVDFFWRDSNFNWRDWLLAVFGL